MPKTRPRPLVLCVLDGWGHRIETDHNAIALAHTPVYDRLLAVSPHSLLKSAGDDVGLPAGQMGNSEAGHMNLGAGRVVVQDFVRIETALADGSLLARSRLGEFIDKLVASAGTCHLMGLLSPGGVHAHEAHILALARAIAGRGVAVAVHAFLDGRDTPPMSAHESVARFLAAIGDGSAITLATVSGRYYAMDRDQRWDRVGAAYAAMADGDGPHADDARAAIDRAYGSATTDEFVPPTVIGAYRGMRDGDGVLMANYRADRVREILAALLDRDFAGFSRTRSVRFAAALGMVEYSTDLAARIAVLLPDRGLSATFGEVIAAAGLRQLRVAESEKYAHVTYFFNGGKEAPLAGEERILVPSPDVATYDLAPEMSAVTVTDKLVAAIESGRFDFILVNYANPDMVGHTGNLSAAIKAVETVDICLGRLETALARNGGAMLVTADHGNAERMRDGTTDQPHTAHTTDAVPLILVTPTERGLALADGRLADVAPTLLALLGLPQPGAMGGRALVVPNLSAAPVGDGGPARGRRVSA